MAGANFPPQASGSQWPPEGQRPGHTCPSSAVPSVGQPGLACETHGHPERGGSRVVPVLVILLMTQASTRLLSAGTAVVWGFCFASF